MKNRILAFLSITFTYFVALIFAIITGFLLHFLHPLLIILISDIIATIIVYVFSVYHKNASFYDPYWSVAPLVITTYYIVRSFSSGISLRQILVIVLIFSWGIRLTWNWIDRWDGINDEDWRYKKYRKENPSKFWLINLFGIHLMPTFLVYLGCLPLYPVFLSSDTNLLNIFDIIGTLITLLAIIIESLADKQLSLFIRTNTQSKKIMKEGLWKYSRHPNYFGEILFWWGLFFFALASNISYWFTVIGPVLILMLFNYISIPLMEERNLKRRFNYEQHIQYVSKLIPWFKKENKENT